MTSSENGSGVKTGGSGELTTGYPVSAGEAVSYSGYGDVNGTSSNGAHTHTFRHSHNAVSATTIPPLTIDIPSHTHRVNLPGHSHDVSIPSHTHDVIIPDHTHQMVYGIFEGTTARSVAILVDDNEVPASETSKREIDVSAWLTKDDNGKITRNSWHEIQIVPDQLTRIEANLFAQVFIQSVGGGDY